MVKNNNEKSSSDKEPTNPLIPEINIPKVIYRECPFQYETPLKDIPITTSLNLKLGMNKFLVDLEKNLESERTKKLIKDILDAKRQISIGKNTMIEHLCGGFLDQPFKIHFFDDVPRPAYKNKHFTLKGNIVDKQNNIVTLDEPMIFKTLLYKAEHPISQIKKTRYNEEIIVGNPVIQTSSFVYLRRISIKEVSSYHPSKMYILVVMPEDIQLVQPYVFTEIVVKTMNLKPCKLRKKYKVEELFKFK
ncbi:hypothetical protein SteCoe_38055 [Stentor coeruleus]|uniref:Uncharacterized protein n=1 Tax=Stentor coeruleus TaxID=5963 RepID=A0A1R2ALX8_9CILI|nr:hypothetical protein SteCoe_38055 [Stentor coeruleus]